MNVFSLFLRKFLMLAMLLMVTLPLCAQSEASPPEASEVSNEQTLLLEPLTGSQGEVRPLAQSGFMALVQAILALIFVLGLVYLTIFFLRKLTGKEAQVSSHIQILETRSIKAGNAISIIEIADRLFIVGVGENITPIGEITDQEQRDLIRLAQAKKEAPVQERFFQMLKGKIQKNDANTPEEITSSPTRNKDFLKDYTSRLHNPSHQEKNNHE
ncbi:FliO/MopB family protein [Entomospira culicis]|nr:flagellar biosynthetic protein FliO [Entomospira culicis]